MQALPCLPCASEGLCISVQVVMHTLNLFRALQGHRSMIMGNSA